MEDMIKSSDWIWKTTLIKACGKWRQKNQEFNVILSYKSQARRRTYKNMAKK